MCFQTALQEFAAVCFKVIAAFEGISVFAKHFRDDGVQRDVRAGDGLVGAQHTEFELVAGESKWRGTVAVSRIGGERRCRVDAEVHGAFFRFSAGFASKEFVEHISQLVADKNGDNSWRRFVGTQTMVVAGRGDSGSEQFRITVDCFNDGNEEGQELEIVGWIFARVEEVDAGIRCDGPVVVFP